VNIKRTSLTEKLEKLGKRFLTFLKLQLRDIEINLPPDPEPGSLASFPSGKMNLSLVIHSI
jgi:hypothetical protein